MPVVAAESGIAELSAALPPPVPEPPALASGRMSIDVRSSVHF
jgi:hypothetical protein